VETEWERQVAELKAGSGPRLLASMAISVTALAFFGWAFLEFSGLARMVATICLLFSLHGLLLAIHLIGVTTPVVRAEPGGMVFDSAIVPGGTVPWSAIKSLRVIEARHVQTRTPWLNCITLRTSQPKTFNGLSRILPSVWLGYYLLPTRMIAGGTDGCRRFLAEVAKLPEAQGITIAGAALPPAAPTLTGAPARPGLQSSANPVPIQSARAPTAIMSKPPRAVKGGRSLISPPPSMKSSFKGVTLNGVPFTGE